MEATRVRVRAMVSTLPIAKNGPALSHPVASRERPVAGKSDQSRFPTRR